jgi:hypothetical protein
MYISLERFALVGQRKPLPRSWSQASRASELMMTESPPPHVSLVLEHFYTY